MLSAKARAGISPKQYLRNKNVQWGIVDTTEVIEMDFNHREIAKYRLRNGDLLMCEGGVPGRTAIWRDEIAECYYQKAIHRLRPLNGKALPEFFLFWFRYAFDITNLYGVAGASSTIAHLPAAQLRALSIPVPDLDQQRQIAVVLSAVQRAIERQERLIALTVELKKALMHKLFTEGTCGEPLRQTEIGSVPESWGESRLGEIARFSSGGTPSREVSEYWTGGTIPWVKTTEINYCTITETEERITQSGLDNSSAKIFPIGSLLMAMYGQGVTRGRVGILGIAAATNQACAAIMPHSEEVVSTGFLYYFLEFHYEHLRQRGHGANQSNLSMTIIKQFKVYYPKLEAQVSIVIALQALDEKVAVHLRTRGVLNALFRTLLHQLMTAQIRVHDLDLSALNQDALSTGTA